MTTLGTHPFIPAAFKLGSAPTCQRCPNEAAHAVHDWLSAGTKSFLDALRETENDGLGLMIDTIETELENIALSSITPEEMVQLENLPNGEPFDLDGYISRPRVEFDYTNQAWMVDGVYQNCGHLPLSDFRCGCYGREHQGETAEQVRNPIVGKQEFSRYEGGR